ncbi:LysR family transcriptional regulator [Saccharophagus degradans]|uniref:LysR family transcriptional regulator n=1 Tax=Saccharophagus degradans TaxID=86304 RepID=UPI001C081E57|nr:LysR family transcriptional regulator [Saccharophagus degradans]MBU2985602.1 LysR family transcriptional regulator [Saccharophagus degradans]
MQIDRLRRMALFAMVVRHGSFSAASRAMDLATSALSSAVSQLEKELEVRLLNRTTRSLSLTESGQLYYEKCVEMLATAELAEELVIGGAGEIAGRLRIAAASDTAQKIVLPALAPLARKYPKLLLDILVDDQVVDMTTQAIDLSIRSGWLRDSSLVARKLNDLHEVLVASPGYLERFGIPLSPDDLHQHRLVGFARFTEPATLTLKNIDGHSTQIVLSLGAMTNNVSMLRDFALQGFGLARLPSYMVLRELEQGQLVLLLPSWELPGAGIYAVTLKRTLQPPKVSAAIAAINEYIAAIQ